ncbi:MAG: hypothetical protein HY075_16310 [Deltaproteobacteria bacterium]|nr:hypothetical protein [Deltaproteobacteria bacterium]
MDRRKDTPFQGTKLPRDYLKLVEDVFNKNFSKKLTIEKGSKEIFVAHGEIFPDELLLCMSLKQPKTLRMTTCYASVDYPAPQFKKESGKPATTTSEAVQFSVNVCVDALASFFNSFFDDGRPVDYDLEYSQGWTTVDIDKNTRVYLRITRDNPELEAEADALLAAASESKKKKKLH